MKTRGHIRTRWETVSSWAACVHQVGRTVRGGVGREKAVDVVRRGKGGVQGKGKLSVTYLDEAKRREAKVC